MRDHRLADRAWLGVEDGVRVRIVWVHLDEAEARRRIQARGNPNDAWKLAHWDDYRTRLFLPTAADYPELLLFDNTAPADGDFDRLVSRFTGRPGDSVPGWGNLHPARCPPCFPCTCKARSEP